MPQKKDESVRTRVHQARVTRWLQIIAAMVGIATAGVHLAKAIDGWRVEREARRARH